MLLVHLGGYPPKSGVSINHSCKLLVNKDSIHKLLMELSLGEKAHVLGDNCVLIGELPSLCGSLRNWPSPFWGYFCAWNQYPFPRVLKRFIFQKTQCAVY